MGGTGKDLWKLPVLLRLFLRTVSNVTARIPLQPQCAHWGSFPPGEAIMRRTAALGGRRPPPLFVP